MSIIRRNLLHISHPEETYFVTYRQKGTWANDGIPAKDDALLCTPEIAQIILEDWKYRDGKSVCLHAVCVMDNHVHVVFTTLRGHILFKVMSDHKSFTGRNICKALGRKDSIWQTEYFDRIIRDGKHRNAIIYTLENPVKAGLVDSWSDWPYSYLAQDQKWVLEGTEGNVGR